jgi:GTP-binding protein EngB required for normal cell division
LKQENNWFVLIDIRHEAQTIDIEFMSYMGESEIPFALFSLKTDKISKVKINSHIAAYKKNMLTIGLKCSIFRDFSNRIVRKRMF